METEQENADVEHFNKRAASYENASSQGYFFDRVQRRVLSLTRDQTSPEVARAFRPRFHYVYDFETCRMRRRSTKKNLLHIRQLQTNYLGLARA
jgi:hypothetical protein